MSELAGVLFFPNSGGLEKKGLGEAGRLGGGRQEDGVRALAAGEAVGPGRAARL
jgi:hypothetical protein